MTAKILVVDDDASHRTMLKAVLSAEGYQVQEADDGDTACLALDLKKRTSTSKSG